MYFFIIFNIFFCKFFENNKILNLSILMYDKTEFTYNIQSIDNLLTSGFLSDKDYYGNK